MATEHFAVRDNHQQPSINSEAIHQDEAIVFVHGLSGSPRSTWSKFTACLNEDPDFKNLVVDFYTYPTRLIRLPFTPPLPGLRDLADGFKNFLEEQHGTRSGIFIVAHSLGGLIVRQMVTSMLRSGQKMKIKRIALLAVPSTGATLANVGSLVSLPHRQLRSLSKDEGGLSALNIDWEQLKVEEAVKVKYIMGGCDRAVPAESAAPYIGRENRSVIIDANHRSIVAPRDRNDIKYKTVKRFLKEDSGTQTQQVAPVAAKMFGRPSDPLFDVYTPTNEAFYIQRSFDRTLFEVLAKSHVWLTGDSGIGKSAAARRAVYSGGWKLYHISLSGHEVADAPALFNALCSELWSFTDKSVTSAPGRNFGEQVSLAKLALLDLRCDKVVANVVEEMPVNAELLTQFADIVSEFLDLVDADDRLYGQVRFAFSSRHPITQSSASLSSKAREKIQFLPIQTWSDFDIARLVKLLTPMIRPTLTPDEQNKITFASRGSPRFVKMVFRHWRNGTSAESSVEALCAQVGGELIQ